MVLVLALHVTGLAGAQSPADDTALRALIAAHERASAAGELRGLVDDYSLDADMISSSGVVTHGRDAIEAYYRQQLASASAQSGRHHTHPSEGIRIRFVTSDVALIDLPSRSVGGRGPDGLPLGDSEVTLLTVWRKGTTGWLVVSQRALPAAPSSPPSRPTGVRDSAAVVAAERRWAEANVACDTSMMASVLSDSLVFVHTDGGADGKRAYLAKVNGCQVARAEISPTSVHVLGDVAIVDGTLRMTFKGRESQPASPPGTYSRVYVRSGSRWLLFAHHSTRITPNPSSPTSLSHIPSPIHAPF
jgi:uncharacterized protein (TIGR02246 family)